LCGASDAYLDEVILDDAGGRMFVCSDTDYCETRRAQGHRGQLLGKAPDAIAQRPRKEGTS
jgi:alpha-D-ribose 1-methylphosphonate 5-phosphate C-P lyase